MSERKLIKVTSFSGLKEGKPEYALVSETDLVVIKLNGKVSVLYGRCLHRGALLSDGFIDGDNLICGVHYWDYRADTGVSEYNNAEALKLFYSEVNRAQDSVLVDEIEIKEWEKSHPQPYKRDEYLGLYRDVKGAEEEPENSYIRQLAKDGLKNFGHHGKTSAMGVPIADLPKWKDIQIITAQLSVKPLGEDEPVNTEIVIGAKAKKPLKLKIPIFISDMSFGALSREAKIALAKGAELAGTGICSGEGGMLPEEKENNSRYFYEFATGEFAWNIDKIKNVQAFHFKAGQGAKTGTGGHLPGDKVTEEIAGVRNLPLGKPAVSPAAFKNLTTSEDFRRFADEVRRVSGGIPIGFKMSAQHIEADIDFALNAGADYIILDGRGGGTGAAPEIFKNNISIPTIPALARARKHLTKLGVTDVSLIITGGLRTESDFVKALALGADGIAISNSAIQAIGCLAMRACHTNNCPVGIATQKPSLRQRIEIEKSARMLKNFLEATVELMKILARACGHNALSQFNINDLTTFKKEIHELTRIPFAGVSN